MINEIVNYMVNYGTNQTLYGNYCFDYADIENKFNIKLNQSVIDDIVRELSNRKEISYIDEDEDDEEISLYFYTNYCPNLICDDEEEDDYE